MRERAKEPVGRLTSERELASANERASEPKAVEKRTGKRTRQSEQKASEREN